MQAPGEGQVDELGGRMEGDEFIQGGGGLVRESLRGQVRNLDFILTLNRSCFRILGREMMVCFIL